MSENIAKDLLETVKQYDVFSYVGFECKSERLSCVYTVSILAFFAAVVFSKTIVSSPLSCYFPVLPKDNSKGYVSMLESYCWVNGTYRIADNEQPPNTEEGWAALGETHKIEYYQLAAFVLGIQCLLFYLPFRLWRKLSFSLLQLDCNNMITAATEVSLEMDKVERRQTISSISERIRILVLGVKTNYENIGIFARIRKYLMGKPHLYISGKKMTLLFLVFKVIYAVNALVQFLQMTKVFGWINPISLLEQSIYSTPFSAHSPLEIMFPLVGLCYFPGAMGLGTTNQYIGECSLTANMILGKLYVFLYFWTLMVAIVSLGSILKCLFQSLRIYPQYSLIKELLNINNINNNMYKKEDRDRLKRFIREYLQTDGVLIIRKLKENVNIYIAAEVVEDLYNKFRETISIKDSSKIMWIGKQQPK